MATRLPKSEGLTEGPDPREGAVAKTMEKYTTHIPSDAFLWGAIASMALSAGLQASGRGNKGNFVGQWVPTLLILGLYNKMVRLLGSEGSAFARNY
jgi:hypothetical protein